MSKRNWKAVSLVLFSFLTPSALADDYPPADKTAVKAENPPSKPPSKLDGPSNQFWWPERLDLSPLRQQASKSNPMDSAFNYAAEFKKLDLAVVKKDIAQILKTSQDW